MTIATREQLNESVDQQFFAEHPDAPRRLDPDDPSQTQLVQAWLAIRDRTLNSWTDAYFYEFFPSAGKLDPGKPEDSQLIEYWNDIYQQIKTGEPGRWSWDSPPPAPLEVVSVEADQGRRGFVLVFNRAVGVQEAEQYLWSGPPPTGGLIEQRSDTSMRVELTIDALQHTREDVARRISEAGVLTSD